MILNFDTRGNDKQMQACEAWANDDIFEIYYGGAKYGGKSFLGCNLIFSDALTYPETHYFIARKELSDLTKHTIPSINEVFQTWGIGKQYYTYNGKDNIYHLYNKSRVYLLYAKYLPSDPLYERFGSMQMTRGWIEEGGEFVEDAYKNLKISIGRWKNDVYNLQPKLLTTLNPKKNYIYRKVYKPHKENKLPKNVVFIQALPQDNKTASKDYIKNLEETLTGSARQRLLLGNWEYDDDDNFLLDSYDKILDIFTIDYLEPGEKYIICDAARFGSDRAIIGVFDELELIAYKIFDKSKTTEISDQIKDYQRIYKVPNSRTLVDSDGVGGGVVDEVGCIGFVNNAKAIKPDEELQIKDTPNYDNIKSQCAFELSKIINSGQLAIKKDLLPTEEIEKITEELEQLKRKDDDNKLMLISKSDMKDNIARSPDWLDVFIMRMFFVIKRFAFVFEKGELMTYEVLPEKIDDSIMMVTITNEDSKKSTIVSLSICDGYIYVTDAMLVDGSIKESDITNMSEVNNASIIFTESDNDGHSFIRDLRANGNTSVHALQKITDVMQRVISQENFIKQRFKFKKGYSIQSPYGLFMTQMYGLLRNGDVKRDDAPKNIAMIAFVLRRNYQSLFDKKEEKDDK